MSDDNHDLGPRTFSTKKRALDYLAWVRQEIEAGRWKPPSKEEPPEIAIFRPFADEWVRTRRTRRGTPLKPRTRTHYESLLDRVIYPTFGDLELEQVADADTFESWYHSLDADHLTQNAHAYSLVRSILRTAHKRKLIAAMPPEIDGAGSTKRRRPIRPLSIDELGALIAALPERYRLLVLLYAWCAVRFGELTALQKRDVRIRHQCDASRENCPDAGCTGVLHVDRGVTRTKGEWHEDTPKSGEGGDVAIPPHVIPDVQKYIDHLNPHDLLFPAKQGGYMSLSSLHKVFNAAKKKIGRPDIRPHDLRHLGSMLAAAAGASPAELMQRLRHKTAQAAQIYWHAAKDRDRQIADRMSQMATEQTNVVPIETATRTKKRKEADTT
ncbi:tyrosine-type recombinase/integrase [Phytoactinopolyspora halophila]|uniref:tyrosine-type recombinase/integrase n=1 Tax=Phytoactinopolyspora halophila TaxID=1981511 RepID=UPI001314A346|nr:tyrosine-type recombinase/integrase [Phytoactinopolyspora halophila]